MITKYGGAGLALRRLHQITGEAITVENIVAKNQRDITIADKVFTNNKGLG
ncbi:hypothetical protein D3C85_1742900 [compost metagenome]